MNSRLVMEIVEFVEEVMVHEMSDAGARKTKSRKGSIKSFEVVTK